MTSGCSLGFCVCFVVIMASYLVVFVCLVVRFDKLEMVYLL